MIQSYSDHSPCHQKRARCHCKTVCWHRDGYLANRVPPLTGPGSAQIRSKGSFPGKMLWSVPQIFGQIQQHWSKKYTSLGTLDLLWVPPKRSAAVEGWASLGTLPKREPTTEKNECIVRVVQTNEELRRHRRLHLGTRTGALCREGQVRYKCAMWTMSTNTRRQNHERE